MHTYLIDMLQCPACRNSLAWTFSEYGQERIETGQAQCEACQATYPVRDGIGLFLTPDLPRNDLWEQVESGLIQHLREHPELEQRLMEGPPDALAPADQFFRALVLEDRGDYIKAQALEDAANQRLFTPEYTKCWDSQVDYVIDRLSTTDGPIVDLASGRCYLVEKLVRRLQRPVVATDFSPGVLRRNRRWLTSFGLYEQVSLLAFDARRTPFKDEAVETLTTNLGLPNIEEPGNLLKELRRITGGQFLAISHFFPEEDEDNAAIIREAGLEALLYKEPALANYAATGWEVEMKNGCVGEARPTPPSIVLEGARIDGLPVADTQLEWCVLLGTSKGSIL